MIYRHMSRNVWALGFPEMNKVLKTCMAIQPWLHIYLRGHQNKLQSLPTILDRRDARIQKCFWIGRKTFCENAKVRHEKKCYLSFNGFQVYLMSTKQHIYQKWSQGVSSQSIAQLGCNTIPIDIIFELIFIFDVVFIFEVISIFKVVF